MQKLFKYSFWAALVFALTMAMLPHPPALPVSTSDKFQHMLAFATLAALASLAYPRISAVVIGLGLIAVGAAIEIVQMIPSLRRDSDWADLLADAVATLVVLLAIHIVRRWRIKSRQGEIGH